MQPDALLATSAEISVAFLGFGAIASVLRRTGESWRPDGRFWSLLLQALLSLGTSLLALALLASPVSHPIVWAVSSAALGLGLIAVIFSGFRISGVNRAAGTPTNWWLAGAWYTVFVPATLLACANTLLISPPEFWAFLAPLLTLHFSTGFTFVRVLAVWLPRS